MQTGVFKRSSPHTVQKNISFCTEITRDCLQRRHHASTSTDMRQWTPLENRKLVPVALDSCIPFAVSDTQG